MVSPMVNPIFDDDWDQLLQCLWPVWVCTLCWHWTFREQDGRRPHCAKCTNRMVDFEKEQLHLERVVKKMKGLEPTGLMSKWMYTG